jgi:hypothetical protein
VGSYVFEVVEVKSLTTSELPLPINNLCAVLFGSGGRRIEDWTGEYSLPFPFSFFFFFSIPFQGVGYSGDVME